MIIAELTQLGSLYDWYLKKELYRFQHPFPYEDQNVSTELRWVMLWKLVMHSLAYVCGPAVKGLEFERAESLIRANQKIDFLIFLHVRPMLEVADAGPHA